MGFTRACFQLDGNDPEAIDALIMEHNGRAMNDRTGNPQHSRWYAIESHALARVKP